MSVATTRSAISRLQKELSDLRTKDSTEARKEADLLSKFNRAMEGASKASSSSTQTSKLREAERAQKDLAAVSKKRADISKSLAAKSGDLTRLQNRLSTEEDQERKKTAAVEKKLQADREKQIARLDQRLRDQSRQLAELPAGGSASAEGSPPRYDVFISHATEDKDEFVRDLAQRLNDSGVSVWYDEFSMGWGDSLRRKIDQGLANSRFGIVILSTAFFKKEWPQRELDGLVQLEMAGRSRILPIWHKVSKDEVTGFSPTLADKIALNTALLTIDEIVEKLVAYRDAAVGE